MDNSNNLNDLTLVSAYFDLSKKEKRPFDKTKANYLKWGNNIFNLDVNMVFYVGDIDINNYIWNGRKKYNMLSKTKIIFQDFDKLQWINNINEFRKYKRNNLLRNGSIRDSVFYRVLTWNKMNFVENTINENPFGTKYFGWIDFGLCRGKRFSKNMDMNNYLTLSKKIKILEIKWITKKEQENMKEYTSSFRYRVAGGLFIGHEIYVRRLIDLFRKHLYLFLSNGILTTQEPILDYVYRNNLDIFNPYYGHYDDIIKNFKKMTIVSSHVIINIKYCRLKGEYDHAIKICNTLLKDCYEKLSSERRFQIWDELMICSFYIDKTLSESYVREWFNILSVEKDQIPHVKKKINRINKNFEFFTKVIADEFINKLDQIINS